MRNLRKNYCLFIFSAIASLGYSVSASSESLQSFFNKRMNASCDELAKMDEAPPKEKLNDLGGNEECSSFQGTAMAGLMKKCSASMNKLQDSYKAWLTARVDACKIVEKAASAQKDFSGSASDVLKQGQAKRDAEEKAANAVIEAAKNAKQEMASILEEQKNILERIEQEKAKQQVAGGMMVDHSASREAGAGNADEGIAKFGGKKSADVGDLAKQLKSDAPRPSEVSTSAPNDFTKDPLAIAQTADRVQADMKSRIGELQNLKGALAEGDKINAANVDGFGTKGLGTGNIGGGTAPASGAGTGGPGNSTGSSKQADGSGGPPGGGSGGNNGGGTASPNSPQLYGSTAGENGYNPPGATARKPASPSSRGSSSTQNPGYADAAKKVNDVKNSGSEGTQDGASYLPMANGKSSGLKLGRGSGSGTGSTGVDGSSLAATGGNSRGKQKGNNSSGSSSIPNAESSIVPSSAAEVGSLGVPEFSLPGSETESFLQNLAKDLGGENFLQNINDPSISETSTIQSGNEILTSESATLFQRTKETHIRCLKKGLLVNGIQRLRL